MKRKELLVDIEESSAAGGRIRISTGALDRQDDRVIPSGARIENYMKNPVVQWGHNYHDPWATIGETVQLTVSDEGLVAEFTLRQPVNDSDPMNVILALWQQGLIRTASIGFNPTDFKNNDAGGYDFTEWELLEWSLVPVPANQEALRLAVKGLTAEPEQEQDTPQGDGPADNHAEPVPESTDADTELGPELRNALAEMIAVFKQHYGGNSNE